MACALGVCACAKTEDPFKEALTSALEERLGEPIKKITFTTFERIDSVSVDQEMSQRIKTFELKYSQDRKFYEKFMIESKPKSAEKYRQAWHRDEVILSQLDSLYESLGSKLNEIAYYDYAFGVTVIGENSQLNLSEAYACITPDLRVVTVTSDKKAIHKTTGASIPGYKEIIKTNDDEKD